MEYVGLSEKLDIPKELHFHVEHYDSPGDFKEKIKTRDDMDHGNTQTYLQCMKCEASILVFTI